MDAPRRPALRGAALPDRLLPRYVEDFAFGQTPREFRHQRALTDPGIPGQQGKRTPHDAATEYAIELLGMGADPLLTGRLHGRQGKRYCPGRRRPDLPGTGVRHRFLYEGIPHLTSRTPPHPLRGFVSA